MLEEAKLGRLPCSISERVKVESKDKNKRHSGRMQNRDGKKVLTKYHWDDEISPGGRAK